MYKVKRKTREEIQGIKIKDFERQIYEMFNEGEDVFSLFEELYILKKEYTQQYHKKL